MIIVKGVSIKIQDLPEVTSILFDINGCFVYVESGIVENELRVAQNWETAGAAGMQRKHRIYHDQGTEIPQELGDYLVALHSSHLNEQEKQATDCTGKTENQPED